MAYKVFTTDEFDKRYQKLDQQLQREIAKEVDQLEENPYSGKPLGYRFFREKRIMNYRVYYLIYKEQVVVFVITISTKKDQQDTIDRIKSLIPHYHQEIRTKLNL
ncbi:MAG TPA: type II toxin-antitoxin system RelE/ParE family toxin [Candidatus Nanoarchaeia archaeon]|nr:type II toxin-antitoxin system RelE/ParE family toxin [Candidatus Nanoarchaeia archaeon]